MFSTAGHSLYRTPRVLVTRTQRRPDCFLLSVLTTPDIEKFRTDERKLESPPTGYIRAYPQKKKLPVLWVNLGFTTLENTDPNV
jgi:hypothetical protein